MAEKTAGKQPGRGNGRPFSKGRSGNPAGRPAGSRNHTTLAIEELLEGEGEAVARKAIDLAKEGNPIAMRLVLERVAPLRRGRPVRFAFPEIEAAADVSKALGHILKATAAGELTPDEAAVLAGILETKRRAIETVEFEERVAALEKASEHKGGRR